MMARVLLTVLLLAAASTAGAQQGAFRFDVTQAADSTIKIDVGDAHWVSIGTYAIAVDPARHDELVARLRVTSVSGRSATAVVTGQVRPVTLTDAVLVEPPKRHWYEQAAVWIALVVGAAIGVAAAR